MELLQRKDQVLNFYFHLAKAPHPVLGMTLFSFRWL